jgi:hypothetical protein
MKRCPTLASTLGVTVAVLTSCTNEPTRPRDTVLPPEQPATPPNLVGTERDLLRAALLFADLQSSLGFKPEMAREFRPLVATVVQRLAAGDPTGMARALATARAAVRRYRELAKSDGTTLVQLAAIDLTLERASAFVNGPSTPEPEP